MQAPCSGLTLPRCRNAVAYIWQGRLGIEPTQAALEAASPALEHSPLNVPSGTRHTFPWRGARGPIPNRNCTGASRASTNCRRRAAFTGRSLYILGARTHHPKRSPPWCRRLGLNQRIPPGAVLYRLSYVCIPPASAGVRRKKRMGGKNEDTDITPHPHSDTYFSALAPNQGQRPIFFAIL